MMPAPSDAGRWLQCPGSVQLAERFPALLPSTAAAEGRAARAVAVELIHGRQVAEGAPVGADSTPATAEMIDAARQYVADFAQFDRAALRVEMLVSCQPIKAGMSGVPEAWHFDRATGRLTIWAFRYGHSPVEAAENPTMAVYAAGILDAMGTTGWDEQHVTVEFRVVQPRCFSAGPLRTWQTAAAGLRGLWNKLKAAAEDATSDEALCKTGPECRWCSARRGCSALAREAWKAVDIAQEPIPTDLPPDALAVELWFAEHAASILAARVDALREQAGHEIRSGKVVPGYGFTRGRGRRVWSAPVEEVYVLAELMGVQLRKPDVPVTPAQAMDALKAAGIDPAIIEAYTTKQPGAETLARISETEVKRAFQ